MSLSQSIVAFLFLSAVSLSPQTSAAIINKSKSLVQLDVTTSICEALDVSLPGTKLIHEACVAAGLSVGVESKATPVLVSSSTDVYVTGFLDVMSGCNSLVGQLKLILAGTGRLVDSEVATLSANVIIPTLTSISTKIEATIATVQNIKASTDAQVASSVYQGYAALVVTLQAVFSALVNLPVLYAQVDVRTSVHATLVHTRATLEVFINLLFTYISTELDVTNLRAALFLSIDAAISATA